MGHERRESYSFRDLEAAPDHPLPLTGFAIFTAPSSSTPGQRWHVGYDIETGETYCECRERAAEEHKHNCWHCKVVAQRYFYEYWRKQFGLEKFLGLLQKASGSLHLLTDDDKGLLDTGTEPWVATKALVDVIDQRLLEWESAEQETA